MLVEEIYTVWTIIAAYLAYAAQARDTLGQIDLYNVQSPLLLAQ